MLSIDAYTPTTPRRHRSSRISFLVVWCMLLASILLGAHAASAQQVGGIIVGTVTDATGAIIPNAALAITNVDTGVVFHTVTNGSGRFQTESLRPGNYSVNASASGFGTQTTRVELTVNQHLVTDFALSIGNQQQTVTVTQAAPLLQVATSDLSNIRDTKSVNDLPLNSRNFTQLIALGPGVVPYFEGTPGFASNARRGTSSYSLNGIRPTSDWNSIKIEGLDNGGNHNGFDNVVFPPPDAIQEFNSQTSAADSQYGQAAGGFINVILKSGTEHFHGDLYEFHRDAALDAKNLFDSHTGKIPHFVMNQFGGTLGGPVMFPHLYNPAKKSTFFFFSVQLDRRRQAQTNLTTVPTALMHQGNFSELGTTLFDPKSTRELPNGTYTRDEFATPYLIPTNRIDPVGANIVNLYPLPNLPGTANNFLYNGIYQFNAWTTDLKVDHYFANNDTLSLRGSMGNLHTFQPGALPPPANGDIDGGHETFPDYQLAAIWSHVISANKVNEARAGFSRLINHRININSGTDVMTEIGIPGANTGSVLTSGLGRLAPNGFQALGDGGFTPAVVASNNFQYDDSFSWVLGKHSLRFGGNVERKQYNAFQAIVPRGEMIFDGSFTDNPANTSGTGQPLADVLLGYPVTGDIQIIDGTRGFRRTELGFFFQDDWSVAPNLTLNLGIRYENFLGYPWTEVQNREAQFLPSTGTLVQVGTNGVPRSGSAGDNNNFGPRVGLAYQLDKKTVVRSAYAIFYAAPEYEITRSIAFNPPFTGTFRFSNNSLDTSSARVVEDGFERTSVLNGAALNALQQNSRLPYVQQWNLAVQRELPYESALTIAYVGNKATKLRDQYDENQAVPGPGDVNSRRPYPQFNSIQLTSFTSGSTYSGLQASLEKRLTHGLSFLASYTWSHCIDGSSIFGQDHQNSLNLAADKGACEYDIRNLFVYSFSWNIPYGKSWNAVARTALGGWQTNGIVRLSTGTPFEVLSGTNTLNNGGEEQRADVVPGCNSRPAHRGINMWFDPACYQVPAQFQYGNSRRNSVYGPGTTQGDLSVFKGFALSRNADSTSQLQFRAEAFNLTNTPQLNNPNNTIGVPGAGTISSAGSPASFERTSRQLQLALKLIF